MRQRLRWIALGVVVAFVMAGPLAPFAAAQQPTQQEMQPAVQPDPQPAEQPEIQPVAQQPEAQPAPPPPVPPPALPPAQAPAPPPAPTPPPPPAVQPAPAPPMVSAPAEPDLYQERLKQDARESAAYSTGAAVVNVFYVPGKAFLCGVGGVVGIGVLLLTFGTGYKAAAAVGREGCGGRWLVTGDDLRSDRPGADWDRN